MSPAPGWFSDPANAAFSAFAIAILSLGVSALAFLNSRKAIKIEEARERDRIAQSGKANLVARLSNYDDYNGGALIVENLGSSSANNIKVEMDKRPISKHPDFRRDFKEVKYVGANSSFSYKFGGMFLWKSKPPFKIEITWEDDSGEPGNYRTTLTM